MKKIIINISPWQTRVAIMRDGQLHNLYFASHATKTLERSFFKGVVTKVLPGIQTAFVDIGQQKAGFLHISEIDRDLAMSRFDVDQEEADTTPKPRRTEQVNIGTILSEGQVILTQVSKEPIYEKGAKLSTCFTLPGRFIVLMPNIPRIGISKKIESKEERTRLRDLVRSKLPEGMGAIIRTTAEGSRDKDVAQDIAFLVSTWYEIEKKYKTAQVHDKLYEDLDIALQVVRDHLDDDIEELITDDKETHSHILKFIKTFSPEHSQHIKIYTGIMPLFKKYEIEQQIDEALNTKVQLKSGGSLIIETTEAMTVVDVNTGKFVGKSSLQDTILKTNLEAAQEVVRQLKLRNIGGLIVIDFIDMSTSANQQKVFKLFEKTLKEQDKFQSVVLKISEFGIVQMTRKRSGKTLLQELMRTCPCCSGLGAIKSAQTEAYVILRELETEIEKHKHARQFFVRVGPELFDYLTNTEYNALLYLEKKFGSKITLTRAQDYRLNDYKIEHS